MVEKHLKRGKVLKIKFPSFAFLWPPIDGCSYNWKCNRIIQLKSAHGQFNWKVEKFCKTKSSLPLPCPRLPPAPCNYWWMPPKPSNQLQCLGTALYVVDSTKILLKSRLLHCTLYLGLTTVCYEKNWLLKYTSGSVRKSKKLLRFYGSKS